MALILSSYTQKTIFDNLDDMPLHQWLSERQFCDLLPHLDEERKFNILISLSNCLIRKINNGLVEVGIESEMFK